MGACKQAPQKVGGDIFQFLFSQVVVEGVDGAIVTMEVSDTETRVWSSWGMESSSPYRYCSFFLH